MRVGIGYDVHKLVAKRKLILGGVEVNYKKGLLGHSDADVLIHAIIDALIGAVGQGSIGDFFPDTDLQFKDASSMNLLQKIATILKEQGYVISNIDSIIVCQEPRLAPYISQMRANIARICGISIHQVNVKGKTEEGLGFTGAKKGIAAHAVCLVHKKVQL
ncbi:MAG: 2-C-methyl-D-erythritol 2 4-cyclodiphosphate synthase [Candidatus Saganbacteria bacterium]|uniref:2-C-methyl-D-erythritol 2,4-cyclodiphosphate synthase n=1 Tax=Candidatus Saganbacteria bacterium TaxID=2575572 RepID=A0A833KZP8_UNCSA|nr:MAG: 2-C-methyl-D-erythritol 2 4-cyclodiphosphate synthase [Candidatus Saganbacteria bacterium]